MPLRSYCIIGFALLATLPLCAGTPQAGSRTNPSITVQAPTATVAPTLAEMRAMTAEQLDGAGDRLRSAKDYLSALDCYREALRKNAAAEYYNKIAITELMLRHPEEAAKAAKTAIRKDKQMAEAWNNLGVAHYVSGTAHHKQSQTRDAIRSYKRAIQLSPSNASFHNNLAAALMDLREFDHGAAEYRRAFELDPDFFERSSENGISARMGSPQDRAHFSFVMARLFASTGDLDHALHFLRSAMEDGYPKIDDVYQDKVFETVRNDERFVALMKERPVAIK